MTFAPGDEVVCVDDRPRDIGPVPGWRFLDTVEVRRGQHYVVSWAGTVTMPFGTYEGVNIVGIDRTESGKYPNTPFAIDRFRPVKRESIEIFRQMCVSTRPLIPVGTETQLRRATHPGEGAKGVQCVQVPSSVCTPDSFGDR
jgi:hypothetical protein